MITATPQVIAVLAERECVSIPAVTLTLRDGTVHRWCRSWESKSFGGTTWTGSGFSDYPIIESYRWRTPLGLDETGALEMKLDCGGHTGETHAWLERATNGELHEGTILLERLYAATPKNAIAGKLFRFYGTITAADTDAGSISLMVESTTGRLKGTMLPRTLYSSTCQNALFDSCCTVTKASHQAATTTGVGSTARTIVVNGGPYTDGYWDLGTIRITYPSGAVVTRGIRTGVDSGGSTHTVTLVTPLASWQVPGNGLAVTLTKGCDHTVSNAKGCGRFSNIVHFRATPYLPREG